MTRGRKLCGSYEGTYCHLNVPYCTTRNQYTTQTNFRILLDAPYAFFVFQVCVPNVRSFHHCSLGLNTSKQAFSKSTARSKGDY